jgi:chromosome segregation ATPase
MSPHRWHLLIALVMVVAAANPVYAQTARGGGGANAELLMQMQQLASERTSLQAENASMKKELEGLRKERDSLKSAQGALDSRVKASAAALAQSAAQRQSTDEELKLTRERMQALVDKFRETIQQLRETETDRAAVKQNLGAREQELKVCIDRNLALYKLNQEVLTRLDKQTFWSRLGASEPFTRIKRVQLENLVDDYKARADEQRVPSASPPPH